MAELAVALEDRLPALIEVNIYDIATIIHM